MQPTMLMNIVDCIMNIVDYIMNIVNCIMNMFNNLMNSVNIGTLSRLIYLWKQWAGFRITVGGRRPLRFEYV